jgi:hypothetical protein
VSDVKSSFTGIALKRLTSDAMLSLREVHALPQVDSSGTYPVAFIDFLRRELRKREHTAERGTPPPLRLPTNWPVEPVLFARVIRAVVSWKVSAERIRLEGLMENQTDRCERRARRRGVESFAEKEQLANLRNLVGPTIGARWIAHLLWGFALKRTPLRPSLLYLKEFNRIYDAYIRRASSKTVQRDLDTQFRSWRSNVYTLRSRDRRKMDSDSIQHFDALFLALADKRGLVRPGNISKIQGPRG